MIEMQIEGECVLCGACVGVCPVDNLTIVGGELKIGEGCIGCGSCEKICPVEAISGRLSRSKNFSRGDIHIKYLLYRKNRR